MPANKKNKPNNKDSQPAKAKDTFNPTPAPAPAQGVSYMNALKTKNAAENASKQQPQQSAPVQVVAASSPAKQEKPAAQAQPAQQQAPAASVGFSYKSALQKAATPAPQPTPAPKPASPPQQAPAPAAAEQKPADDAAKKAVKKDEAAPAAASSGDKPRSSVKKHDEKLKFKLNEKVNIPPGAAAYIIGKGGQNVKRINEQTGARVSVKDNLVSIQANTKQQYTNAKRQVLELLKAYLSRVQTQQREFNIFMPDADSDALKVCMVAHNGPLSEWIVRDATPKVKEVKKPAEVKDESAAPAEGAAPAEPAAAATPAEAVSEEDLKPVFYTTNVVVDESLAASQEAEVDEEQDTLNRMVEFSSGSKKDDKADKDSDKPVQGASISLIDKQVLKETFTNFADKLVEEHDREVQYRNAFNNHEEDGEEPAKQQEEQKKKEHHKNSIDAEVNIGKKLFYINPEAKRKRKNKAAAATATTTAVDKVEDVAMNAFLDYKFGYSHKFHMAFNYALSSTDVSKIETALQGNKSMKTEKRTTLAARISHGYKKANAVFTIDSQASGNVVPVKIIEYYEKSSRFSLIDFLRPKTGVLDFRIIGRYYSKTEAPAYMVDLIAKRVRFDKEKNEIVVLEDATPAEAPAADAKKPADDKQKQERFNVYLDRIKNETLYADGKFTVVLSQVKDIVKQQKDGQVKKSEDQQQGEDKKQDEQEEDESKQDQKIVESLEATVRCSGLRFDGIENQQQTKDDTYATMQYITQLLESVGL